MTCEHAEPFQTSLPPPPGLPWADTNRLYEQAETVLVQLRPDTPQIFATGSDHYTSGTTPTWSSPRRSSSRTARPASHGRAQTNGTLVG
jgi:hypothetical protein